MSASYEAILPRTFDIPLRFPSGIEEGSVALPGATTRNTLDSTTTRSDAALQLDIDVEVAHRSPYVPVAKRWTRTAWVFFLSIAFFVVPTTSLIIWIEILERHVVSHSDPLNGVNLMLNAATLISAIFLLCSAWAAIQSRNMICVIGVVLFNLFLILSGFLEAFSRSQAISQVTNADGSTVVARYSSGFRGPLIRLLWAVPAIDLCFHIVGDVFAFRLFKELGWYAYRKISADLKLRMHYRRVLLFGTLSLYAGFFACLQTFITAVEVHGTKRYFPVRTSSPHLLSIYVASPVLAVFYIITLICHGKAIRTESRALARATLLGQIMYFGWVVYLDYASLLILASPRFWTLKPDPLPEHYTQYISFHYWTTLVFPRFILTLIVFNVLVVVTFIFLVLTIKGFGKGLKPKYASAAVGKSEPIDLSKA